VHHASVMPITSESGATRPAIIPAGTWPRRMGVELAAGYCGESTGAAGSSVAEHDDGLEIPTFLRREGLA
jgi:hypothetical protein